MKLLAELVEMAKLTRRETGMGMTQFDNENFILAGGFRSGNSRGDQTRLKYMIFDPKIFAETKDYEKSEIGYVELFAKDGTGEIQGLVNIELKPKFRKSGYGKRLIKDLVDTTQSGLSIFDIQKKAQKFWDKMGVQYTDGARRFGHIPKDATP